MKVIIYNQENGIPAFLIPTDEALAHYSIFDIALKDVPYNKKFKIIDSSDLPLDYPQESWVIDELELTDGVGSELNTFPEIQNDID